MHPDPLPDRDLRVRFLCWFAVLNPLVVQASFFFAPSARPLGLSIPQIFQGTVFLVGAAIVLESRWRPTAHTIRTGRLLLLVIAATSVFLCKSVLKCGESAHLFELQGDFVFYFKMVFWASSWFLVALLIRREEDAECLLRAVVLGALLTACIALVCYVTGAGTVAVYAREGVRASVGASGVSVKHTVAFLAPCAVVAIYLGKRVRGLVGQLAALILVCSTLLSYDRAIQVGLVAAALWLVAWRIMLSDRKTSHSNSRLFVVGTIITILVIASIGFQPLRTRWTSDLEKGRPGSGRLEFYRASWEQFSDGSPADVLLGVGYSGIIRTMKQRCGMAVHTHSDLFDLLLGGGLLGLAVYAALILSLAMYVRGVPASSAEIALMGSVGAIFLVMSLITGLLTATHAMFCLGAIFHCGRVMATGRNELVNSAD